MRETDIQAASTYLVTAMELAEHPFMDEAAIHQRDFMWQMRQLGLPAVLLRDHFLAYEHTRAALYLLRVCARLESQLLQYTKSLQDHAPLLPQVQESVAIAIQHSRQHFRQRLDKERQVSIGVTHYIWVTEEDEKVRESHARNAGQTFAWDNPPATGHPGSDYGCRCSAAPSLEGMMLPDDPPIEPVYPIEELVALLAGGGLALRLGIRLIERLLRQIRPNPSRNLDWKLGSHKSPQKWQNQMQNRGWTEEEITNTIENGVEYPAPNLPRKHDPAATATRYEYRDRYVVRDDQTNEILQISNEDFLRPMIPK